MQNLKSQLLNTSLLLLACFTILVNAQNTFYNPEGYIEYIVSVRTGDMKNAGTNNQIYITIFGETGETRGVLMNPLIKGNPFEKGNTDKAHFNAKDVGPVTSVTIYVQSNTAFGGDWYLDEIEVERLGQGDKKYNFVIGRWLESGGFSFELAEKTHELKVTVRTSDIRKAGTDADVFIRLHGSLDKTAWMQLDAGDRNLFERGDTDHFTLRGVWNIGTLEGVEIMHNNSGPGSGWHLGSVAVTYKGGTFNYNCECWMDLSGSSANKKMFR